MSAIFISYRREDAEDSARALYESLLREFGKERLFMDVEAIALGSDFRQAVEGSLDDCGVFLAIIGPGWLDAKTDSDPSASRRLDNPSDYVRQEVATALKRGAKLPVIPVLVRGAKMPSSDQLPDDLKDLAYRNALTLSHLDWDGNVQKLVTAIRPRVSNGGTSSRDTVPSTSPSERVTSVPGTQPPAASGGMNKGLLIGLPLLIVAAIVAYFVLKPSPKPGPNPAQSGLAVTIVRNSRLANVPGPVDVMIDDAQQGQIRFDEHGSTPIQIHATAGEHRFAFVNPQTKASCSGTFNVNASQPKLLLRMRDNGTVCSLETFTGGEPAS